MVGDAVELSTERRKEGPPRTPLSLLQTHYPHLNFLILLLSTIVAHSQLDEYEVVESLTNSFDSVRYGTFH